MKKIFSIFIITLLIFSRGAIFTPVKASAPTPPPAPEAPSAPAAPTPPPAPEAPSAPAAPTPTLDDQSVDQQDDSAADEEEEEESSSSNNNESSPTSSSNDSSSSGTNSNPDSSQVGDSEIDTGDATNSVGVITTGNNNTSAGVGNTSGTGASVVNDSNGADSTNNSSTSINNDDLTTQNNSASVLNNVQASTTTGENSASDNVGSSSITTGDASTTGTIVTAVNTNVDGVAVAEFNIVDDHVGDIVLDFGASCIAGCAAGSLSAANLGNGSNTTNNSSITESNTDGTFQNNDATVANNLTLESNSGDNTASRNTGGDSEITTGDAFVAASVLTFANNNIAGNVVYGVVNIFGDLIGDIIMSEESLNAALGCNSTCQANAAASNIGNGTNSTNDASLNLNNTDELYQFNNASIENNLILDAETGDNTASRNTGGTSNITTGDSAIDAQVLNIANSNISGGNWWLVIVNEAGNWVGKILGTPDGANLAGTPGTEFTVNEFGEITATNNGNGSNSTNNATVDQNNTNITTQNNTANIVNNVNLAANTGGNKTSDNTGGNSDITTGDAEIIANLVNFVNNNISGNGRLVVTVVNVFGSWLGDFVTPGQQKQQNNSNNQQAANSNAQGGTNFETESSSANSSNSNQKTNSNVVTTGLAGVTTHIASNNPSILGSFTNFLENNENQDSETLADQGSSVLTQGDLIDATKGKLSINLAWVLFALPLPLVVLAIYRRKILIAYLSKSKFLHF